MLAKLSVKKPYTVIVAVVLIIILGVVSFTEMTPDLLPSINLPYSVVITTYPGASPEEVESTITRPVEQSMATLNDIQTVSSISSENVSMVILEFSENANMDTATIEIRENLNAISGNWSDSVGNPTIMNINPDMLPVMVAAVDVENMDTNEISEYASEELIPQLEGVTGVASVSASGLVETQVNVMIRQEKVDELNAKIRNAIDGEFEDKEQELADAREEVEQGIDEVESAQSEMESGLDTLTSSKDDMINQLAQARAQMNTKQIELLEGKLQLVNALENLQTEKDSLQETRSQLEEAQGVTGQLEENLIALSSMISSLEEIEANINTIQNSNMSDAEKEAALAAVNEQLAAISPGLTTDAVSTYLEELKTQQDEITAGLSAMDTALSAMGIGREEIPSAIAKIDAGLIQIDEAAGQLQEKLTELEQGKTTLSDAMAELESQSMSGTIEIASSMGSLTSGQQMLESNLQSLNATLDSLEDAKEEMQSAKDSAYDASDMNNVITVDMVSSILEAQNFSMPAGYITEEGVDYLVKVGDELESIDEISGLMLFDPDIEGIGPVYLKDVADVYMSDNAADIYAKINGNKAAILSFNKQSNYATAEVTENIQNKFENITDVNGAVSFTELMNQGDYIHLVVNSVLNNLLVGAILAILVLLFFLKDIRPTMVIAISIPVSVIFAIVLMYFSGVTINIISMAGLAIGVGMLVDNSVVVIENIYRLRGKGVSVIQAAVSGTTQMVGAITASTLTTVCVFLPIVFTEGLTRTLFVDMALTVGYSLMASLIVAITVVPMMASGTLKNVKEKEHKWFDAMLRGYRKLLVVCLNFKPVVLILAAALLIGCTLGAFSRGMSFMPSMDSTQVSVSAVMPDGSTHVETIVSIQRKDI